MTELEKKAEEYAEENSPNEEYTSFDEVKNKIKQAYKNGYEQGQKDFDTDVTKILNGIGITFIDTNSIGGLIGLHGLMLDLEKENEELKAQVEKMKCCSNCKHYINNGTKWCLQNEGNFFECDLNEDWELAE